MFAKELNYFQHIILTSDRASFDWKIKSEHGETQKQKKKNSKEKWDPCVPQRLKGIIKAREKLELLKSRWDFRADAGGQHIEKRQETARRARWWHMSQVGCFYSPGLWCVIWFQSLGGSKDHTELSSILARRWQIIAPMITIIKGISGRFILMDILGGKKKIKLIKWQHAYSLGYRWSDSSQ